MAQQSHTQLLHFWEVKFLDYLGINRSLILTYSLSNINSADKW